MFLRLIWLGALLMLVVACNVFDPNFYKPGPSWFQYYAKPGANSDDVMRALLECGARSPISRVEGDTPEHLVLIERCMFEDGFGYSINEEPMCVWSKNEFRACQPDAVIPKRDPQRRLNSQFCKTNNTWKICQR